MKKRVLQVNLDGTGGAFSLIYEIQKQLKKDYVFDYYWMGKFVKTPKLKELNSLGSKIYEGNLRRNKILGHILLPFCFYKFLKKHPYSIVHINADLAYKELLYALPAKKAGVKKIIIHSHSSGVNGSHKLIKLYLHKLCKPFLKKNGDVFLTCSKLASKWMFNDNEKAITLNNGVDLQQFQYKLNIRNKIRDKLNINNILIGTVGNLSYQKNPEFLVRLIKQLDKKYKLIFVGDGPNRKKIEKYAKQEGVFDRCIFYGNSNNVAYLLNAMDIFIMPSRFEGLPVSAVEAQATGLPCCFSKKITREVALTNSCYFLSTDDVKKWVQIIRKITPYSSAQRKNATKILKNKKFDIRDCAKKLDCIYKS